MTDLVILQLAAGDGGNGRVSFLQEKRAHKGGPDGGRGGSGGNIVIIGDESKGTLKRYAGQTEYFAEDGQNGGGRKKTGRQGEDIVLKVPIGTEIWAVAENELARKRRMILGLEQLWKQGDILKEKYFVEKPGQSPSKRGVDPWLTSLDGELISQPISELAETAYNNPQKVKVATITEHEQKLILCQGGFGGRGNISFKSSTNTTPLEAEYGTTGEQRLVIFELKLLADVGLVGFPNAGKSTLLSRVTAARPKVANYPFTTLEPHLGIMQGSNSDQELVLADIPGLIEGASQGKGLGHDFLRHLENCSVLLFVLALDEATVFNQDISVEEKAAKLVEQFNSLAKELEQHGELLIDKPWILSVNKTDLYSDELIKAIKSQFDSQVDQQGREVILFSAATGENTDELQQKLHRYHLSQ